MRDLIAIVEALMNSGLQDTDNQPPERWDVANELALADKLEAQGRVADAKWHLQRAKHIQTLASYRAKLLKTQRKFFGDVAAQVVARAPEALEIWLIGSRSIAEHGQGSDWDFVVMMPDETPRETLAKHHMRGQRGLGDIPRVGSKRVDFVVERLNDTSNFTEIAKSEGLLIWRSTVTPERSPAAPSR